VLDLDTGVWLHIAQTLPKFKGAVMASTNHPKFGWIMSGNLNSPCAYLLRIIVSISFVGGMYNSADGPGFKGETIAVFPNYITRTEK